MSFLWVWFFAYAVPALVVATFNKLLPQNKYRPNKRNALITHGGLVVSILLSQYFIHSLGFAFPFAPNAISIFFYVISIVAAYSALGWLGGLYGLSVFLQQLTIVSIAWLLLPTFSLVSVILLIVPLFVFCHELTTGHSLLRILLISVWGILSLVLFSDYHDMWLIMALHTFAGTVLIKRGFLYPELVNESR